MLDLLELHKYFICKHLRPGDNAVDFTMGNGHDTEFLCRTVGESGHVWAFDIQKQAVESTAANLAASGCPQVYTLINDSHHNVKKYVDVPIRAGMFNLGYLPGGDKRITTLRTTTMPAVEAALDLLDSDGILLVAVYPGHEEGRLEGEMLDAYFRTLDRRRICVTRIEIINSPTSPFFFVCEKK